ERVEVRPGETGQATLEQLRELGARAAVEVGVGQSWRLPREITGRRVVPDRGARHAALVRQRVPVVVVLAVLGEDLDAALVVASVRRRAAAAEPPRRPVGEVTEWNRVGRVRVRSGAATR